MSNHLGTVLTFLVFCYFKMSLHTGHVEQIIDHLYSYTSGQLLSIRRNKYTLNLDKMYVQKLKNLVLKEISGDQEEENKDQEYRTKTEASMKNGLNHYPNTIQ